MDNLEEMQGSIVCRRMPTKLIRPVMLWGKNIGYNEETRKWDLCKRDDNAGVDVRIDMQYMERTLMRDKEGWAGLYKITERMSNW